MERRGEEREVGDRRGGEKGSEDSKTQNQEVLVSQVNHMPYVSLLSHSLPPPSSLLILSHTLSTDGGSGHEMEWP